MTLGRIYFNLHLITPILVRAKDAHDSSVEVERHRIDRTDVSRLMLEFFGLQKELRAAGAAPFSENAGDVAVGDDGGLWGRSDKELKLLVLFESRSKPGVI